MRKSRQSIIKSSKTKLNIILTGKRTAKISALSSENVGKYKLLTDDEVLPEKT